MKKILLTSVLLAGTFLSAQVKQDIQIKKSDVENEAKAKGFLGVQAGQLSDALMNQLSIKEGIIINEVIKGSPADKMGLKKFDIITKIDGKVTRGEFDISDYISTKFEGDVIKLEFIRATKTQTLDIKLAKNTGPIMKTIPDNGGIRVLPLGGQIPKELQDMIKEMQGNNQLQQKNLNKMVKNMRQQMMQLNLQAGNGQVGVFNSTIKVNDGEHSILLTTNNKKKTATVKDNAGNVIFEGPVGTPEDLKLVPAEVRAKVKKLSGNNGMVQILRMGPNRVIKRKIPKKQKAKKIEEVEELQ